MGYIPTVRRAANSHPAFLTHRSRRVAIAYPVMEIIVSKRKKRRAKDFLEPSAKYSQLSGQTTALGQRVPFVRSAFPYILGRRDWGKIPHGVLPLSRLNLLHEAKPTRKASCSQISPPHCQITPILNEWKIHRCRPNSRGGSDCARRFRFELIDSRQAHRFFGNKFCEWGRPIYPAGRWRTGFGGRNRMAACKIEAGGMSESAPMSLSLFSARRRRLIPNEGCAEASLRRTRIGN